nr:retrovirus-related Pol polyprotein from transposon TNT 1-94 [Tanacetum cinerariifolium]
ERKPKKDKIGSKPGKNGKHGEAGRSLIDRKKVIITEDTIRQALRLDDVAGVDCLPNEDIFVELARMGYEKPTAWNEFSSFMASAVICLATGRKFNFSKYIFDSMYTSLALTQKVFANIRRIGKGFSRVDTPLFDGMLVQQQVQTVKDAVEDQDDVNEVSAEPTLPSPTPVTPPPSPTQEHIPSPPQAQTETCATLTKQVANLNQDKIAQAIEITKLKQRVGRRMHPNRGEITELDADEDVTLVDAEEDINADVQGRLAESQVKVYHLDLQHAEKVLSMKDTDEAEPVKVEEVIKVVTTSKLITKVVTTAATTITASQVLKASAPRRRRGVVIQDPEETAIALVIVHSEVKSRDKGKGILIKEPKPLKRQAQIKQDEAFARQLEAELNVNINWNDVLEKVKRKEQQDNTVMRYQALKRKPITEAQERKNMMIYLKNMVGFKMDFFKVMTYNDIRPIFEKHYNSKKAFLEKGEKEIKEEGNKRKGENLNHDAAKKQRIDEETEELKTHLQIVANDDDVEDLEMLWKLVQKRFQSSKPKNFSDDFLLNTLKIMFEKPNSSHHNTHNYSDDSASGKEIPFNKIHSGTNVEQCNPQQALKDKGVINIGCLRHMIGNISYLSDFKEINEGYVVFGGNPKGGKITAKDENHVLLRVPRENNMYNVDLKNIAEAVNTAYYVQNRVLVTKPHNKTPYELLLGRTPIIGFMRPFGCPVTILNTLDPLGKFDGIANEGSLVGYSISSKAFRVFNSRTRIVQETLHINFLENQPNVAGSGPTSLFDIDTLTQSMKYQLVVAGINLILVQVSKKILMQNTDVEANFDDKESESEVHVFPSSSDKPKKHDEKAKRKAKGKSPVEFAPVTAVRPNSTNSTNNFNVAGPFDNVVSPNFEIGGKSSFTDLSQYPNDPNMPSLEDIVYSDDEEDVGAEDDFSNLETSITVSPIPTTRAHKDHPFTQIIGDLSSAP